MQHFPFPESERVIYETNPLIEVVAQIRFPKIYKIGNEAPAEFQDCIRKEFPFVIDADLVEYEITSTLGNNGSPSVSQKETKSYTFSDSENDPSWKTVLCAESIALSCLKYERREDFSKNLTFIVEAFLKTYRDTLVTRFGVRYRNVIDRNLYGLNDKKWNQLIFPSLLGIVEKLNINESQIQDLKSSTVINLNDDNTEFLRLTHGYVTNLRDQDSRVGYSIDSDFWSVKRSELSQYDISSTLERYSKGAGRVFRWGITPFLHERLGPRTA